MELEPDTLIGDLLERYPFLIDHLVELSEVFGKLKDPLMRKQMGAIANLQMVSTMGGMEVHDLIQSLGREILRVTGDRVIAGPQSGKDVSRERMEALKSIILDLHHGSTVEEVRERFLKLVVEVDSSEIARMEQELTEEGLPEEEIKKLCDVHVEVFRDSLDKKEELGVPPGHPIHTFMKENEVLDGLLAALKGLMKDIGDDPEWFNRRKADVERMLKSISKVNLHYQRKENQLFPLLEKHNVSGPSQVMWALHDDIRNMLKESFSRLGDGDLDAFRESIDVMSRTMKDMIYKEEKVLYPMSLDNLDEGEWSRVRRGEEEIGYAWIKPEKGWVPVGEGEKDETGTVETMKLDEGMLTLEQLNFMLRSLPVDISFVDENDRVAYYSATDDRIFPRSPGVIGREVSKCHPPKSVAVVQRIISEFRAGKKDVAEFWIQLGEKFVHIRYFAVRNGEGRFLGTLEMSQDVTGIRKLEGERRLLDWDSEG